MSTRHRQRRSSDNPHDVGFLRIESLDALRVWLLFARQWSRVSGGNSWKPNHSASNHRQQQQRCLELTAGMALDTDPQFGLPSTKTGFIVRAHQCPEHLAEGAGSNNGYSERLVDRVGPDVMLAW